MEVKHQELKKKEMDDYSLHSFGYGDDHDEKILSGISKYKKGCFYYIKDNEFVDECFLDCLG